MTATLETYPALAEMMTSRGRSVDSASRETPVLLVFLRHFGCTFCREALKDLSSKKESYEKDGVHLIFVHMADPAEAESYFLKYHLENAEHVSDPECRFYSSLGLGKGSFSQLFGLRVMMRGVEAGIINGHGIGRQIGDGFQMPGVFLVQNGIIRERFVHQFASDRPDYDELVSCCILP